MTAALLSLLCLAPAPLCARLSDRSFRARESAQRSLAWLGSVAVSTLEALEDAPPDAETLRRCRHLLAPTAAARAARRVARWRPLPWIERGVAERFADVPECAYRRYESAGKDLAGRQYPYPGQWCHYRAATELLCRDLFAQRVPAARVLHLLGRLAAAEYDWTARERQFSYPR